ncbi:MAG TPA: thiamine ABC transporter substrate-binding protein [Spirochaetota bacterium]|nr:thiamine ABC transporter substrate-binding protein [Spirochaetota bacterium]
MKKTFLLIALILLSVLSCKKGTNTHIIIYSYSSMNWMNEKVIPAFQQKYDVSVDFDTSFNDTGDLISKVILEKNNPKADLIMGITPSNIQKLTDNDLLKSYKSENLKNIKDTNLIFNKDFYVTPFDYGAIAVLYDPKKIEGLENFSDLWKFEKKLIIQDPRSSSTGLDFLIWTVALYNDGWKDQWTNLKHGILTATSGWSEAFAKFESGEAPMMISYATDPAYSFQNYNQLKYKVFIPKEGGYVQIESAGIIKKSKNSEIAGKFIDFMLTEEFQKEIPLNQWMFPVTNVKLPESFKYAEIPQKIVEVDSSIYKDINRYLSEWEEIFSK